VKFNDADLIGLPLRATVSARGLEQGMVEIKRRDQDKSQKRMIPLDETVTALKSEKEALEAEIRSQIVEIPYQ
ncbi:MAG TPA: proline--tRNA ligase, partial [Chloroflexi bacterium]|nr:proline--tRNA ligase [Chloroflexota bacterium]